VFVRNINICGRILTQFTCLFRTNTVAAKRDLLAERTGLGKSVSVSLRKNGPEGSETAIFYFREPLRNLFLQTKIDFATVHGPGPDGQCTSCWYGSLRVQKLTLSVFNAVKSPGQSFCHRHFFDQLAPSP